MVRASDTAGAAYAVADLVRRAVVATNGGVSWKDEAWSDVPDFPYQVTVK